MSDSEDDVPLALRRSNPPSQPLPQAPKPKPAVQPKKTTPATAPKRKAESDDGDDDDSDSEAASSSGGEDMPLSERKDKVKRQRSSSAAGGGSQPRATRGSRASAEPGKSSSKNGQIMWKTLKHHGVLFPPEYEPHGVKMLYDGKPVDLTPEQEVTRHGSQPDVKNVRHSIHVLCMRRGLVPPSNSEVNLLACPSSCRRWRPCLRS